MGKLTIEGKAAKEYSYDLMEISMTFRAAESTAAAALERVMTQTESFLGLLEKAGGSSEKFKIGEDTTEKNRYSDKTEICAKRELKICIPFDMEFANYIRNLIQKNKFDVDLQTKYRFSDSEKIHDELIKLALEDAKEKAAYIAEAMGQKLVGIDSVEVGKKTEWMENGADNQRALNGVSYYDEMLAMLSRKLQAPTEEKSETVLVIWNIE